MKALCLSIVFVGSIFVIADPAGADPVAEIASFQVPHDYGKNNAHKLEPFWPMESQGVSLIVRSKKSFVGFDRDNVTLTFGGAEAKMSDFATNIDLSDNKKAIRIVYETKDKDKAKLNAKGELEVKGKLPVTLASTKAEIRSAVFQVKAGEAITFPGDQKGLPTLKISKAAFNDDNFKVEFTSDMKMSNFAGMKFLTKEGKVAKYEDGQYLRQPTESWTTGDEKADFEYNFPSEHKELIIVLEVWTDKEEKIVEVDLKASLTGK
jgi:hypothetical protein